MNDFLFTQTSAFLSSLLLPLALNAFASMITCGFFQLLHRDCLPCLTMLMPLTVASLPSSDIPLI